MVINDTDKEALQHWYEQWEQRAAQGCVTKKLLACLPHEALWKGWDTREHLPLALLASLLSVRIKQCLLVFSQAKGMGGRGVLVCHSTLLSYHLILLLQASIVSLIESQVVQAMSCTSQVCAITINAQITHPLVIPPICPAGGQAPNSTGFN